MPLSTLFFSCFLFHNWLQGQAFLHTDGTGQVDTALTESRALVFPSKILFLKMQLIRHVIFVLPLWFLLWLSSPFYNTQNYFLLLFSYFVHLVYWDWRFLGASPSTAKWCSHLGSHCNTNTSKQYWNLISGPRCNWAWTYLRSYTDVILLALMELLSICTGVLNWAFAFQDLYILFSYH